MNDSLAASKIYFILSSGISPLVAGQSVTGTSQIAEATGI